MAGRAGRFVTQAAHYSAFMPEPLPPTPPLAWDEEMQTMLSKADRALGRLDGSVQTLPNTELFVAMYVRKEAVLSSQIEGTQSSLNDVLEAEAAVSQPDKGSDVGEVLNYIGAMNYGLNRLNDLPISIRLIREIHQRLMRDVRGNHMTPGEIRRSQNWIGPEGSSLNDAIFVPPPPHEVERLLSELEQFIHERSTIPPLVKVGLVHAQFETIHPFLDGNGRLGRLLITFFLCQSEILIRPVLYLSHYFKRYRSKYYDLLQGVRDDGDWESWIKFFLDGVATISLEATSTARAIVSLREADRTKITQRFGRAAGSGLRVLENLYEKPLTTVNQVKALLGVTYPSASDIVSRMVDADILHEITGQERYRLYQYSPYVRLFSDPRLSAVEP